jgi:hypothetical protein
MIEAASSMSGGSGHGVVTGRAPSRAVYLRGIALPRPDGPARSSVNAVRSIMTAAARPNRSAAPRPTGSRSMRFRMR